MFKPPENPMPEQLWALEKVVREGVDALAAMLRESYDYRARAVYVKRLIEGATQPGEGDALRAEVKRLLERKDYGIPNK